MKPRVEVDFNAEDRKAFRSKKPLYFPKANEFLLNHARVGILLALQSLHLPKGSKVGVMVYNCHTVMNAVAQAGCEVVFVDIDDNLKLDLDDLQRKSAQMEALIVTHLFGIINDIEAIRHICPQTIIIEDCAHAYDKAIEGDFGVYSIGQGKLPSLGDGGLLIVNDGKHIEAVKVLYDQIPNYSHSEEIKLYAKLFVTSVLYKKLIYGVFTNYWKRNKKPVSGREVIVMKKMSNGVKAMFALRKNAVTDIIKKRLQNARKESDLLKHNSLVNNVLCGSNAFMLVAFCTNPDDLKKQYTQIGIETATHFSNSLLWAREFGYHGDCPNSERLKKIMLMIPVY